MSNILLINPPIYDFASFDLWSKPLGLLYLSSILKEQKLNVDFLDYCDRVSFLLPQRQEIAANTGFGCGHYLKTQIEKPQILKNIPRKYSRYGIPKSAAESFLKSIQKPDLIIITSIMTFWYFGLFEAIESLQEIFPNTPIVIGGIYASLCYEHFERASKNLNKKNLILVKGNLSNLNSVFEKYQIPAKIPLNFSDYPLPDYSFYNVSRETSFGYSSDYLLSNVSYETLQDVAYSQVMYPQVLEYAVIRMSQGCPFKCSYCAQSFLSENQIAFKNPQKVFEEISFLAGMGIKNIVFYDDALLYESKKYIKPLLKKIIEANLKIKIHTPNGLHLKFLDLECAVLMKEAGFILPRFSLETAEQKLQKETGGKTNNADFENAVKILNKAGFNAGDFIIYLIMGMPNQKISDIENSIKYVHNLGGKISLSEYSVIPHTKDFENLDEKIRQDFLNEPLLHNKSIYPLLNNSALSADAEKWKEIYEIKLLAKKLNNKPKKVKS